MKRALEVAAFIRKADRLKVRLAKDRDDLRALLAEYEDLAEKGDQAVGSLEQAIDHLSELV